MNITLKFGDISLEKVDAIVNSAGTSLRMGAGVAGALKIRGGNSIENEILQHKNPVLGEVLVTKAGDLKAKYVLHAIVQPHFGNFKATEKSIRDSFINSLKTADKLGCKTIAIPALGCGIAEFNLKKAAKIFAEELGKFKSRNLKECKIVLFSIHDLKQFKEVFENETA